MAGRFVQDHQVFVFKYHIQGNRLGDEPELLLFSKRKHQPDIIQRANFVIAFDRFVVDQEGSCLLPANWILFLEVDSILETKNLSILSGD